MKQYTYSEIQEKIKEAEKLQIKYKEGKTSYSEETRFLRLVKEIRQFTKYVKVVS